MNSGDWVESLTARVEDDHENWKILHYNDLIKYNALKEKNERGFNDSYPWEEALKELNQLL